MSSSLSEVMAYTHPAVVRRFKKDHPAKADLAEQYFNDLMMFFWTSTKHAKDRAENPESKDLDFVFIMDEEMKEVDFMWHTFLLYTKDYMDFCDKYFGEYLHHLPDVVPTFGIKFDPAENLEKFLSYVYDYVGEDVVRRWFPLSA